MPRARRATESTEGTEWSLNGIGTIEDFEIRDHNGNRVAVIQRRDIDGVIKTNIQIGERSYADTHLMQFKKIADMLIAQDML